MARPVRDITGQRYGRLTATKLVKEHDGTRSRSYWICDCTCGGTTKLRVAQFGEIQSCGCLVVDNATTHAHRKSGAYSSYYAMLARCTNPNNAHYAAYGGAGITVCKRWLGPKGFVHFLADMGERPLGKTIDRINGKRGYMPSNCRWATRTEQNRNRTFKR